MPPLATPEKTAHYATRFPAAAAGHFRVVEALGGATVSSIGLGTYLGDPTPEADEGYRHAIVTAVGAGCNVVDSAINYRFQRSERSIGAALKDIATDGIAREELVICTKGGFFPFEGDYPRDPGGWIRDNVIKAGLAQPDEIAGGSHCMTPAYLRDQLSRSLSNMGVDAVDVYYVHNPESQLHEVDAATFDERLTRAFAALEEEVAAGRIGCYGTATWNGYRVAQKLVDEYLSLERVLQCAQRAVSGGSDVAAGSGPGAERTHHFRAIQLPVNLAMPEALASQNQVVDGRKMTILQAAWELKVAVFASGSLLQSRLARGLPSHIVSRFGPDLTSDAARALQFARSAPGVATALVGMGQRTHAAQNMRLAQVASLTEAEFAAAFG